MFCPLVSKFRLTQEHEYNTTIFPNVQDFHEYQTSCVNASTNDL